MALLAEHVPEQHRERPRLVVAEIQLPRPLGERACGLAGDAEPGQVALDVDQEDRHAARRQAFGQHLQRHRLAGAGRAGDEPVPVGVARIEDDWPRRLADDDSVRRRTHLSIRPWVEAPPT
jgi:hypothetical protein